MSQPRSTVTRMEMGWYPDPLGRYQERYHNGKKWTLQVNNGGAAFTDTTDDDRSATPNPPVTQLEVTAESYEPVSSLGARPFIIALLLAALVAAVFISQRDDRSSTPQTRSTTIPTAAPSWEQKCPGTAVFVEYQVLGSTRTASLTYSVPGGGTAQRGTAVPMSGLDAISGCFGARDFLYISAQNTQAFGTVVCTVTRDGRQIASVQSSGEYVIATCSP